jgi:hypothetical protein
VKVALLAGVLLTLLPVVASAEALPDFVLDKDYQSCMGNDTSDKERAAYCACVRDGMRTWDVSTYLEVAGQAVANAGKQGAANPGKLEDLAKQCIEKAAH